MEVPTASKCEPVNSASEGRNSDWMCFWLTDIKLHNQFQGHLLSSTALPNAPGSRPMSKNDPHTRMPCSSTCFFACSRFRGALKGRNATAALPQNTQHPASPCQAVLGVKHSPEAGCVRVCVCSANQTTQGTLQNDQRHFAYIYIYICD